MDKEKLTKLLAELDEMVLQVALMYAKNYLEYGVDVTEKWLTATQQQVALYNAKYDGYNEGRSNIIRCKDCIYGDDFDCPTPLPTGYLCQKGHGSHTGDWFCADGTRKEG